MKNLLPLIKHPIEHAIRYVARRPGLKARLRPLVARVPFVYRWVVERRTRQIRADFLKAWMKRDNPQVQIAGQSGFHLSAVPARSTDEVLQAIRKELGQSRGESDAG